MTNEDRRRIKTEEEAKVVTVFWGTKFRHFLAARAILYQDDLKNRMNSSFSSYNPGVCRPFFPGTKYLLNCPISKFPNPNFCNITWNVEENQILNEIFRFVSRFLRYISCYIAESRLLLVQCSVARNWINSFLPKAATTFAFSSVLIFLLWPIGQWRRISISLRTTNKFPEKCMKPTKNHRPKDQRL